MVSDLENLGLPPKLCYFIYNLIHFRKIQFVINGNLSETKFSYKGVPQGSILSPLLFNLYVAKCKDHILNDCKILQFADDIVIFKRSADPGKALQSIESSAHRLTFFLNSKGLEVSPLKSALVVFSRSRKNLTSFSICLNGIIRSVPSHKFLGIILDYKFNGSEHVKTLVCKCKKLSNIIRISRGTWWGADPRLLINIYKSLIRGSMEYGCFVLPINNYSLFESLEKIQRYTFKLCIGFRASTPSIVVLAESHINPLKSRFLFLSSKFIIRSFAFKSDLLIDLLYEL